MKSRRQTSDSGRTFLGRELNCITQAVVNRLPSSRTVVTVEVKFKRFEIPSYKLKHYQRGGILKLIKNVQFGPVVSPWVIKHSRISIVLYSNSYR